MNTDNQQLLDLFCQCLDLPKAEQDELLLKSSLNPEIVNEVRELLALENKAGDILPSPSLHSESGEYVGDFKLMEELGRGGMGVVYLAEEVLLGRLVALKFLSLPTTLVPGCSKRFEREARIAARLSHPSLVQIHRYGSEGAFTYIAYEYIEGTDLEKMLESRDTPWTDLQGAARLLANIADGLHHAHQNGVIHRDVKPSNILIDLKGRGYLTDFGLAKDLGSDNLTHSGVMAGTFLYMSPEQVMAHQTNIDHRTDIYSLGVVLYEVACRKSPFDRQSKPEVLNAIASEEPVPPSQINPQIPKDFEIICLKALRKRPEDRFQTAADLATDLRLFAEGDAIKSSGPSVWSRIRSFVRRNQLVLTTTMLAAAALLVGIWVGYERDRPFVGDVQVSAPANATVYTLRFDALSGEYKYQVRLGQGSQSVSLDPGFYRIVVISSVGLFQEFTREVVAEETVSIKSSDDLSVREGVDMVRIPAGDFVGGLGGYFQNLWPKATYTTSGFLIGRFEVTNQQFRQYMLETGSPGPDYLINGYDTRWDRLPVVDVTWYEARSFAEWAGARLPTRLEWDRAARGMDGNKYPWGNEPRESADACLDRLASEPEDDQWLAAYLEHACEIGSSKDDVSQAGLTDVLGNVSEWLDTANTQIEDDVVSVLAGSRMVKGMAWLNTLETAEIESMLQAPASVPVRRHYIGFRLAKSVDPLITIAKKE